MRLTCTLVILLFLSTPCGAQTGRPLRPGTSKLPPRSFIQGIPATKPVVGSPTQQVLRDTSTVQNSENGWYLSPHGTIRVLVLFAEVVYDKNPEKDPQPNGAEHWQKGQLPRWKDDIFDPRPLEVPKAMVTRYYHDISLGQYRVLGDYIDQLFILHESQNPGAAHGAGANGAVIKEANRATTFRTAHGLRQEDFDLWKDATAPGLPKVPGPDDPHSYDHVMVILRNSSLTHGQGSTDPGSSGQLFGYESDTQSRFGGMNALPFEILKHEYNHLLLGGNNFHSGGGNASTGESYFICLQGGHSMMGAASSALLTCSAWDRDRLGWRTDGASFRINARDRDGAAVDGDLDPMAGDTGVFVLRDFVPSGDALRIRLPFLPEDVFPQWLWLENHQGMVRNGSPTDRFHWEENNTCIAPVDAGIFAMVQVDREVREGKNVFGGYADYLRALPANGMFDLALRGDTVITDCPFEGSRSFPFFMDDRWANPLVGNHELELLVYDRNSDGRLERKEHVIPRTRIQNGRISADAVFFGRPEHAFRMNGNRKIGMGTNPGSANMITLVSAGTKDSFGDKAPNDRVVYLNSISVELLSMSPDGALAVRVRNDDTVIDRDVRWCADSIVLPALKGRNGFSLELVAGKRLLLDRSNTPSRIDQPDQDGGKNRFNDPTRLSVLPGATISIGQGSTLELAHKSELHLLAGASLILTDGAKLVVDNGSRIILHAGATFRAPEKTVAQLTKKGRIITR